MTIEQRTSAILARIEDMRAALAESPTAEEIAAAIEEGVNSI